MSDFSRFRSAFNGFSRTDVVNYIEETSAAHQKAIEQLADFTAGRELHPALKTC